MDPVAALPAEIIAKILSFVNQRDLCSFVQVSKLFYQHGSSPSLWKAASTLSKRSLLKKGLRDCLSIPRFAQTKDVDLSYLWILPKDWNSLFLSILDSPKLNSLDISSPKNLEYADLQLCGQALARARTVKMTHCNFSGNVLIDLLQTILDKGQTKELFISKTDMTGIGLVQFYEMLTKLEFIDLSNSCLSSGQISFIMTGDKCHNARIAFSLEGGDLNDTASVCDEMLVGNLIPAMTFERMQEFTWKLVDFSAISADAWANVLRGMTPNLKSLTLEGMGLDLVNVPGDLLADRLSRLADLTLSGLVLDVQQWTILFAKLSQGKTRNLSLRMINLSDVNVDHIILGLQKIRSLSLNYVCLNTAQWNALFTRSFPNIPDLTVVNVNLSEIQVK